MRAIHILVTLILLVACSPKIVYQRETVIEYKDRIVRDTATFYVDREVEKVVTRDTVSRLENKWAKSEAVVSDGMLSHSLESKPRVIKVPVEVHVTDTLYKESEIKEIVKEKTLSKWQSFKLAGFWVLSALLLCGIIFFRK